MKLGICPLIMRTAFLAFFFVTAIDHYHNMPALGKAMSAHYKNFENTLKSAFHVNLPGAISHQGLTPHFDLLAQIFVYAQLFLCVSGIFCHWCVPLAALVYFKDLCIKNNFLNLLSHKPTLKELEPLLLGLSLLVGSIFICCKGCSSGACCKPANKGLDKEQADAKRKK